MFTVPLEKMSQVDKLRLMERLWEDLSRNEAAVKSPAWHRDILDQRRQLVQSGKARFSPWDEAKERIRKKTRAR